MWRGPLEIVTCEFLLASPTVSHKSFPSNLDCSRDGRTSDRTTVVSGGVAFRICTIWLVAFWRSSGLVFSLNVLLASMWCIRTVILIQALVGRISVLIYQIDQIYIWSIANRSQFTPSLDAYWYHFQYMICCYRSTWTCPLILEKPHWEWKCLFLD